MSICTHDIHNTAHTGGKHRYKWVHQQTPIKLYERLYNIKTQLSSLQIPVSEARKESEPPANQTKNEQATDDDERSPRDTSSDSQNETSDDKSDEYHRYI